MICPSIACLRCRTKIVCTLGPASNDPATIGAMIEAGMSVARINFSHGTAEENARVIRTCREVAAGYAMPIGILADLQGPKLRIGSFAKGKAKLKIGQEFELRAEDGEGDDSGVNVPHPEVLEAIAEGHHILLGDGDIEMVALRPTDTGILCRVVVGGTLLSRKGITVPGIHLRLPVLTEKDHQDLAVALEERADFVALSFVQQAADIELLRAAMQELGAAVPIVAKIERRQALECFDQVLAAADAVMVARGDLGLEVPAEEVPIDQKMIIAKARAAGKPVITATQMLESMMANPRPTRAEASDVANAILDGTDAVMLSGETAAGKYPVEAVRMMRRIAEVTEKHLGEAIPAADAPPEGRASSVTEAISEATCRIAAEVGAKAIVAATMSGWTARMVARHRPWAPIVAVTPNPEAVGRLTLVWGVAPILSEEYASTDAMTTASLDLAVRLGLVDRDDLVVLTAGVPLGGPGRTNMIRIHRPSEILTES